MHHDVVTKGLIICVCGMYSYLLLVVIHLSNIYYLPQRHITCTHLPVITHQQWRRDSYQLG